MRILSFALILHLSLALTVRAQTLVDSFPSPGSEPRGLAWDGEYLWCADAQTDSVYQLSSSSGVIISGFSFTIQDEYGGITWSNDENIWLANGTYVYKLDSATGSMISSFSCPGG